MEDVGRYSLGEDWAFLIRAAAGAQAPRGNVPERRTRWLPCRLRQLVLRY